MRYLFPIFFILFVAAGCNSKKEAASTETTAPADTVVVVMKPEPPKDSLAVYLEKTPCFGRCPVYKVKVYQSGFATYEGLNFAEKMGLYSFRFSESDLDKIYQMAKEIEYFELDSEYNDPRVTDLPSTISEINLNDESHRVNARMGIPKPLKDFHINLGVMLQEKDWRPYSLR